MAATQTAAARHIVTTIADFESGMNDSLSNPFTFQKWMKAKGRIFTKKTGSSQEWRVLTDRPTVDEMSRDATANFTPTNPGLVLTISNKGYKAADIIHDTDIAENSGSKEKIIDLLENRVAWLPEAIRVAIETDAFGDGTSTTYGTNAIQGAAYAIVTTGTVYGQAFATHTALNGQVNTGGVHATFSTDPFPSLVDTIIDCYRGTDAGMGMFEPDGIFIDPTGYAYVLNAANDVRQNFSFKETEAFGVKAITFMGVPIMMNRFSTSGVYFTFNSGLMDISTPYGELIQSRRKDEMSPVSMPLLNFFYGRLRFKIPRAHSRTTYT